MTGQTAEPRTRWIDDWLDEIVMGVLAVLFIAAVVGSLLAHWHTLPFLANLHDWLDSLFQNSGTELFGALLTFLLIETLVGSRDRRRERLFLGQTIDAFREALDEQERRALVNQLSSRVPGFAAEAVRLLKHRGWYDEMDVFRALQNEGDFSMADLHGLRIPEDISGLRRWEGMWIHLDLRGAKLERADLRGVQLPRANLSGAQMQKANLSEAQLEGAYLGLAQMERADLSEAQLDGANLHEVQLGRAGLRRVQLEGADLRGAQLERAVLFEARLQGADLHMAQLANADLRKTQLVRASLIGAQLEGAVLSEAQLEEADLYQARLDRAYLNLAQLEGARRLTTGQLEAASELGGCTLPDGTLLPHDWQGAFAAWVARGREEGWIYDHNLWGEGYIDVEKIPPRDDDEGADA